jgi:uncharacterized membrane protein (DUF4010 family)
VIANPIPDVPLPEVPRDALGLALVLGLAFFIGIEREEHKQQDAGYAFGGVRTFPLIGLVSYSLSLISSPQLMPWALGFVVVGGFMLLSYRRSLSGDAPAGLTTEISALATYVVGGLVQREFYWIATTLGVLCVLLLELKKGLEGLTKYIASSEIVTVAKFLMLSVVVLPIVPNRDLTRFHLNPFKTWLVVVAVSGISFGSYLLQRLRRERGGVVLSAMLGGAYSSTMTTLVLSREAKGASRPNLFAGSILCASGVMYARLVVLLALFNPALARELAPAFGALGALGVAGGLAFSRRPDATQETPGGLRASKNPLEIGAAFMFAGVFGGLLVVTNLVREHLGISGLYALAAIMGVTDVDPFILGLAQGSPMTATTLGVAASAVVIAAASNNVVKAIYAYAFGDRVTGRRSLALLLAFAALGLVPLAWR